MSLEGPIQAAFPTVGELGAPGLTSRLTETSTWGVADHQPMVICLDESRIRTVAQVRAMLKGTYPLEFTAATHAASHCGWSALVLGRLHYRSLSREDRGMALLIVERGKITPQV